MRTGEEDPTLPNSLRDKWLAINTHLAISRRQAYGALNRRTSKNPDDIETDSSQNHVKTVEEQIDNQDVSEKDCSVSPGIKNEEERIKKKEIEYSTIVDSNDSTIGFELGYNNQDPFLYEVNGNTEMPDSCPVDDSYLLEGQDTNYWELNEVRDNLLSQPSQPSFNQGSFSVEVINEAASKVLPRIQALFRAQNKPVHYTKEEGKKDLGINSDLLYKAVYHLNHQGLLDIKKVRQQDGKVVNYYTPVYPANTNMTASITTSTSTSTLYVLPPDLGSSANPQLDAIIKHFTSHPFPYSESWGYGKFCDGTHDAIKQAMDSLGIPYTRMGEVWDSLLGVIQYLHENMRDLVEYTNPSDNRPL